MKKTRLTAAALLLVILLGLCACGAKYVEDVPMSRFSSIIDADLVDSKELAEMNSGYLSGAMHLDPASFASYVVKINAKGVNIDEYGVFRAPDAKSVDGVKDAVEGYLKMRRDTWMKEYMPEEKPKLDKAEVKVFGTYVLYVIASDTVREQVFKDVEKLLKK